MTTGPDLRDTAMHQLDLSLEFESWPDRALAWITHLQPGTTLSADDLREVVGDPPRPAGMGWCFRRASKDGLLEPAGVDRATRPQRRASLLPHMEKDGEAVTERKFHNAVYGQGDPPTKPPVGSHSFSWYSEQLERVEAENAELTRQAYVCEAEHWDRASVDALRRDNDRLTRMVHTANDRLIDVLPHPCADHDCLEHAWWDPECDHIGCTKEVVS